jgi:hypothetical protein
VLQCRGGKAVGLLYILVAASVSLRAQVRVGPEFRPLPSDIQVLESDTSRADLPCQVTSENPLLGFDLRFHASYSATIPVKELSDAGGKLIALIRVTPAANPNQPAYFVQRFQIPAIPPEVKGEGMISGSVELGYGVYHVDWMMRDAGERVCSSHWELEVKPHHGERNSPSTLGPYLIADRYGNTGGNELPVEPAAKPRHIKILLNLSPNKPERTALTPGSAAVLLSMLRAITLAPGIAPLSLVAFNIWEQKVIERKDTAEMIDFAALAKTAEAPTNAIVDYHSLQDPQSDVRFLSQLLGYELSPRAAQVDAIIIIGPKLTLPMKIRLEALKESGTTSCPIFYLNYNPDPVDQAWPDAIRSALKVHRGAMTYNIFVPQDLATAMKDILSRIGVLPYG